MTPLASSTCLALGTAAALGLARFAFGLLLPTMREQLDWSLGQAGALATANGVGYLAGAVVVARLVRRFGASWVFRVGMASTTVSLAVTAASGNFAFLSITRITAGFAGALVFIAGGIIATRMAEAHGSAAPIVTYFSGTGLGIALSGIAIPQLLHRTDDLWSAGWLALGLLAGLATLGSWAPAAHGGAIESAPAPTRQPVRRMWRIATAYLLFGAGYITYATFLDSYQQAHDASLAVRSATWALLGVSVLCSPLLWSRAISRWPGGRALALLLTVVSAAAALPLVHPGAASLFTSAAIFGATFMAVPSAVTALLGTEVQPHSRTAALATFTALFAIGQAVGPWLAGAIADRTATGAALGWTVALCAIAGVLAASQRAATTPDQVPADDATHGHEQVFGRRG